MDTIAQSAVTPPEPRLLASGHTLEITSQFERVDVRHSRTYAGKLHFALRLRGADRPRAYEGLSRSGELLQDVQAIRRNCLGADWRVGAICGGGESNWREGERFAATFERRYERPSEIPTNAAEMRAALDHAAGLKAGELETLLVAALERALAAEREGVARLERRQQAEHVARDIASRARKVARLTIDYEARRAALDAELARAEQSALETVLGSLRGLLQPDGSYREEGEPIDAAVMAAGMARAADALAQTRKAVSFVFPDTVRQDVVSPEEV